MAENPRYVFFREVGPDGPFGAAGVALTPGRSLAVDTAFVALGTPLWLVSVDPDGVWNGTLTITYEPTSIPGGVPEPATWGLMIAGFGLVGMAARRRKVDRVSA